MIYRLGGVPLHGQLAMAVESDWTRGHNGINGQANVPLETAGVAESSRHWKHATKQHG